MYQKKKKDRTIQQQLQFITLEDLVPQDHILRDIDCAIDFSFIYEEVDGLYSPLEMGRPGIDPVSLFKIVLIQYLFGIRSMRQTIREINVNVAYRWFIGYGLIEPIPHFSTFSKNYARRFQNTAIFIRIFQRILKEAAKAGFIDASAIFIDGTHIKASANKNKSQQVTVTKPIKQYQKELDEEIEKEREQQGKKPLPPKEEPEETTVTKSKTDPESGLFVKGEHERQFAYIANTACDKHNFILDFIVGAGNIHDNQMFHPLYEKLRQVYKETKSIALDAGFKTPGIMREIIEDGKIPVIPYTRPKTKDGFFKKQDYVYDEYYDCYLCPENQILAYVTTNREGYRQYKSNQRICQHCPKLEQCTLSQNQTKIVNRHIWADYSEQAEEYRYIPKYREIYKQRKQTIERVFADAKEKHGMRYTMLRGLKRVTMQVTLTFLCMNLKKLAMWKRRTGKLRPVIDYFLRYFSEIWFQLRFSVLNHKKSHCFLWMRQWLLSTVCPRHSRGQPINKSHCFLWMKQ